MCQLHAVCGAGKDTVHIVHLCIEHLSTPLWGTSQYTSIGDTLVHLYGGHLDTPPGDTLVHLLGTPRYTSMGDTSVHILGTPWYTSMGDTSVHILGTPRYTSMGTPGLCPWYVSQTKDPFPVFPS